MSDALTVLVCGGRSFGEGRWVTEVLDEIHACDGSIEIVTGGQREWCSLRRRWVGADYLAGIWALGAGVRLQTEPADWRRYGRSAGPRRNRLMLERYRPQLVIAFPGGRGTAGMAAMALREGVEVRHQVRGR